MKKEIKPIAIIRTDFTEKFGIPRQSGRIKSASGKIEFLPPYNIKTAIKGLEDFSHIWVIFDFSAADYNEFSPTVRPPRLGGNKRVGVFATRSPFRPNGLGLSSLKLLKINSDGSLSVSGVDILDGTPIYDIKPYIPYADIHDDATGSFAEKEKNHRLIIKSGEEKLNIIPKDKTDTIKDCLCDDPRPSYQEDSQRIYKMAFSEFDISFRIDGENIYIEDVKKL